MVMDGMADVFSKGHKPTEPTQAKAKSLRPKVGRLAVESGFLAEGLKR